MHHFLAEELAHRRHHLALLVHQLRDPGIAAVQALAAGRHRVADVDASLRVVPNPDIAQVVCLLKVDGILVAGRTGDDEAFGGTEERATGEQHAHRNPRHGGEAERDQVEKSGNERRE